MSRWARRASALVAAAVLAWPAAVAAEDTSGRPDPVSAGQEAEESTSTTSSTTTTLAPGDESSTTSSSVPAEGEVPPGEEAPPPTLPPGVPPPEDAAPEDAPLDPVVIPPPVRPPTIDATRVTRVVTRQLLDARDAATTAEQARLAASENVTRLEDRLDDVENTIARLRNDQRKALKRVATAKETMEERAADAYVRGPLSQVSTVFESKDPNDFVRRVTIVRSVLDADNAALEEFQAARAALNARLGGLARELESVRDELDAAKVDLFGRTVAANQAMTIVTSFEAGSAVAVGGFVFPVGEPHNFVDTFGAPRMTGTTYEHSHQGTDIFAPSGTPLYASERGVLVKVGNDVLGGIKLWLVGASGHRYYYAHMSALAEGVRDGLVVEAGDVVGFVGNTGNAASSPSHLHFQIHPKGGAPANPYPILKVIDDATEKVNAGR